MRVTFVLPHAGMSGGVRVIAIYAERLQRRGHRVSVVSIPPPPDFARRLKSLLRGRGWPSGYASEPSWFDGTGVPHRVLERVRPVTDADVPDADVVVATYWTTASWVAALAPRKGAKAIFVQGYEAAPGRFDPALDAVWRLPLAKIVIASWLADLARSRFGDENVHLVPNSVDTGQYSAPPRGKQARPTAGMLYAASPTKGADVAAAALERVRRRLPDVHAIAFSNERVGEHMPLPGWIEFHYRPAQDEIPRLYARCDVWLCASRREGFSLPALEAMACRCPLVSTRMGGPADFVQEGVNGFLVPVDDAEALAERLVQVLGFEPLKWGRMSDAALATAKGYTWDDATALLERALAEITPVTGHR